MLVVDDDLRILTMTANARRWLEELTDGRTGLPESVRSVAARVRQFHDSDYRDERLARARVPAGLPAGGCPPRG